MAGRESYNENYSHLSCCFMNASELTLEQAPVHRWCRVAPKGARQARLQDLGFVPLENVRVLRRSLWRSGAMVVQVGNAVFALRPAEAADIPVLMAA